MRLVEIIEQKAWDRFVWKLPWTQFQQSWVWGEFQETRQHAVRRFGWMEGDEVTAACQLIRSDRFLSGYWYAPRGPVFAEALLPRVREFLPTFIEKMVWKLPDARTFFYRFEPAARLTDTGGALPLPFRRNHSMSPASTVLLSLLLSEEKLLSAMHPKTRYNIRTAERHGVVVREGQPDEFPIFLDLLAETAKRDAFLPHPSEYLAALFYHLAARKMARLRFAEHAGRALAAHLEISCGDTVTYLHGASSTSSRELMAPYALHWEAIKTAKREGHRFYDFWGVNPASKANYYYKPSWEGISRFKLGWGGEHAQLVGTWDLPRHAAFYRLVFFKNLPRG